MSTQLITATRNCPLPSVARRGDFIYDHRLNTNLLRLLTLTVSTVSGNKYHWFFDGDVSVLRRNGEADAILRNVTQPVWVNHDGGRALCVETVDKYQHFVRTSRVLHAEWFVEYGSTCIVKHEYWGD